MLIYIHNLGIIIIIDFKFAGYIRSQTVRLSILSVKKAVSLSIKN